MSGFFDRLDRKLNPDLYRQQTPPTAANFSPPPTDAPEPTYSAPLQPTSRIVYGPPEFVRTVTDSVVQPPIPQTTVTTATPTYSYAPQPFQVIKYQQPQVQVQVVEKPVVQTNQYQPPVQTIQYQQPVIQYQQPQVQVVEKPVVQYVDKYVRPPAPPPQVVHHTEVRLVPGGNGRLAQGFGYGGITGYEYGPFSVAAGPAASPGPRSGRSASWDNAYGYQGNDFAYAGAPQYAMPSMYSDYPLNGDPAIPPPRRFGNDPMAGAPFTPRRGGGGGGLTPRSAKRSLAYGGSRESAYRLDL